MRIEDLKILLVVVCTLTPLLVNCQVGFTREQILQEKERLKKESVHIGFWLADQVIPNLESHGNLTTFIAEMESHPHQPIPSEMIPYLFPIATDVPHSNNPQETSKVFFNLMTKNPGAAKNMLKVLGMLLKRNYGLSIESSLTGQLTEMRPGILTKERFISSEEMATVKRILESMMKCGLSIFASSFARALVKLLNQDYFERHESFEFKEELLDIIFEAQAPHQPFSVALREHNTQQDLLDTTEEQRQRTLHPTIPMVHASTRHDVPAVHDSHTHVTFHRGERNSPGSESMNIFDFQLMDEDQLENKHYWIQDIFPNSDISPVKPESGRLGSYEALIFQRHVNLGRSVVKNLQRFLEFIGLKIDLKTGKITGSRVDWRRRLYNVLIIHKHNCKRVTRVLLHLQETGFGRYAYSLAMFLGVQVLAGVLTELKGQETWTRFWLPYTRHSNPDPVNTRNIFLIMLDSGEDPWDNDESSWAPYQYCNDETRRHRDNEKSRKLSMQIIMEGGMFPLPSHERERREDRGGDGGGSGSGSGHRRGEGRDHRGAEGSASGPRRAEGSGREDERAPGSGPGGATGNILGEIPSEILSSEFSEFLRKNSWLLQEEDEEESIFNPFRPSPPTSRSSLPQFPQFPPSLHLRPEIREAKELLASLEEQRLRLAQHVENRQRIAAEIEEENLQKAIQLSLQQSRQHPSRPSSSTSEEEETQTKTTKTDPHQPQGPSLPATSLPATSLPATSLPATSLPATSLPATSLPATSLPATSLPATSEPTPHPTPSKRRPDVPGSPRKATTKTLGKGSLHMTTGSKRPSTGDSSESEGEQHQGKRKEKRKHQGDEEEQEGP